MYLRRIEIQGFKTFAKKTAVDFPQNSGKKHVLAVIVGPNGSGKSNIADAIRWCLGEQSMKYLRGKKTEDIIFSGSDGRGRSGFAEVTLTFDNHDKALAVDYTEVNVTRRLYRDGESEYLLNGTSVRLQDIQLLLAEAGIGQRTYTVVAQGMIDHVLTASPEERKVFFDDATGVRGLQIKRHQSLLKLKKAVQNLMEVEMLVSEIEPRLNLLRRQVKRLEKRELLEQTLQQLQSRYYAHAWFDIAKQLTHTEEQLYSIQTRMEEKRQIVAEKDAILSGMEKRALEDSSDDSAYEQARGVYQEAERAYAKAREKRFAAERDLEMARIRAQSSWSPLPLAEIIKEVDAMLETDESIGFLEIIKRLRQLKRKLTRPNDEDFTPPTELTDAIQHANQHEETLLAARTDAENALAQVKRQEKADTTEIFAFQRELRQLQAFLHEEERKANEIAIEKARIETRREHLLHEMQEEVPSMKDALILNHPTTPDKDPHQTRQEILRIKHQLEQIGAIDEETVREFHETEERYTFLTGQITDIKGAVATTEKVIDELDGKIRKQSEKAFKQINEEFQKYFRILFGGGSCSLLKVKTEVNGEETKVTLDRAMEELVEERMESANGESQAILKRFQERKDEAQGVDIQATPPGKKLKALNLLSGGERALTSIALLSAIMATNPSPFVVLDEVDAALDEANTVRFANILNELRKLTQFIVITHNRATMERADILYGVTMGNDGISNLISVTLADIEDAGSARR